MSCIPSYTGYPPRSKQRLQKGSAIIHAPMLKPCCTVSGDNPALSLRTPTWGGWNAGARSATARYCCGKLHIQCTTMPLVGDMLVQLDFICSNPIAKPQARGTRKMLFQTPALHILTVSVQSDQIASIPECVFSESGEWLWVRASWFFCPVPWATYFHK